MIPVSCLLGHHNWKYAHFEPGFSMRECCFCGKLENRIKFSTYYLDVSSPDESLQSWIKYYENMGISVDNGELWSQESQQLGTREFKGERT